jgi:hypothetical protein
MVPCTQPLIETINHHLQVAALTCKFARFVRISMVRSDFDVKKGIRHPLCVCISH